MLAEQRFEAILQELADNRAASVTRLCELTGASEATIRRDLTILSRQGRLNKVHGGAVLASSTFRYRYQMSFFFYFTSIFGGGLVPWYIFNTKYLHFHNSIIALILPILINVTYLLILKSYMAGIPEALYESARLDGAGDFTIYLRVAMPLCKAGLATVGLFIALNYWNDWYDAMLFLDEGRSDLYPLQYYLNNILTKAQAIAQAAARSGLPMSEVPSEPMKLAMTVVATGPIILLYPFLQKYFVKGVTIGAVKG